MSAILDAFLHVVLPAAFFIGASALIAFELARRLRRARKERPVRPAPVAKPRTPHAIEPLFARLRAIGVEVWEQAAPPSRASFRVVLLLGHESVYMCPCCGQRGKVAFGEVVSLERGRSRAVWLGHVCGHCGSVDRYSRSVEASGFFSATLEHGGTLLDVVTSLEAQAGPTIAHRVLAVLAEREAILTARGNALRAVRDDIAARTGAATSHPFRGWSGGAPFKA